MDYQKVAIDNTILKIRAGSHLFGTNTPDSDLDLVGIFMPVPEMVYGLKSCEVVEFNHKAKDENGRNTSDAVDCSFYEFRKFIKLAMQNNPNILHILFVNKENLIELNSYGQSLLDNAWMFPYKGAHHRFVAYADAQKHKMRIKVENYEALQEALAFLAQQNPDAVLGEFRGVPIFQGSFESGKHLKVGDLHFEVGTFVKKAIRMIEDRLSKVTNRASLFTKYGFDTKFGSNLIHLLKEGIDLMKYGKIVYPLPYASEIVDIKQGKYELEYILEWAERLVEEARRAYETTSLPEAPRTEMIESFVVEKVREYLQGDPNRGLSGRSGFRNKLDGLMG